MQVPVARRNLLAEKGRFAISVAGVAFAVLLILTVLALYRGWSRSGETFRELPGQLWVVQNGTTDPFHSVSLVERRDLEAVNSLPGVEAAVPVLSRQMSFRVGQREQSSRLMALGFGGTFPTDPELRERYAPDEGQIIIESVLSREAGLHQGDEVTFGDEALTVARVRPRSGEVLSPFAFINFRDAERIFGVGDIVTYGMIVASADADLTAVSRAIEDTSPRIQVFTADEFAKSIRKEIDQTFIPVIAILVAIGFVVGAAVVGLTIYTATIENAREFAVMKACGGSPGFLYRIVLSQSAVLTAAGFVVGVGGAILLSWLAERAVPEFTTDFQLRDLGLVFGAALLMAVLASTAPVRRINAIDPASVFRA